MRAAAMLRRGRRLAESRMTETVRIGTETEGTTLDPETGQYRREINEAYAGPARYKSGSTGAKPVDAQGQLLVQQDDELSLPIDTSTAVHADMVVIIDTSATDPGLVGIRARIKAPSVGSDRTARRFAVDLTT